MKILKIKIPVTVVWVAIVTQFLALIIVISGLLFLRTRDRLCDEYRAETGLLQVAARFSVSNWRPLRFRLHVAIYPKPGIPFRASDCVSTAGWFCRNLPITSCYIDSICVRWENHDSIIVAPKFFKVKSNRLINAEEPVLRIDSINSVVKVIVPAIFNRNRSRYHFDTIRAFQDPYLLRCLDLQAQISGRVNWPKERWDNETHDFVDSLLVYIGPMHLYDSIDVNWQTHVAGPIQRKIYTAKVH